MQVRRLRLVILGLTGLCFLAGLALLLTVLTGAGREPVYQGKSLSVWFREYAFSSNTPVVAVGAPIIAARAGWDGRVVVTQMRAGKQVNIIGPTNPAAVPALLRVQMGAAGRPASDPAWDALEAIGSNAVPYLVSQLRSIPFEATYTRAFTNSPVLFQKTLPNPWERRYLRMRALDALSVIGDPHGIATPALLQLLRKRDQSSQYSLYQSIRKLGVDRRLIGQVLLEFGAKGRHGEVLEIAENLGWEGDEVAELLGKILKSSDVSVVRRRTIVLLERSGTAAAPALDAVLLAMNDSDAEVRYMAVRTLEGMGASTAEVADALRTSLNDSNVMVQAVARRMLSKMPASP